MAGTSPAMTRSKSGGAMNRVFAIARAIAIAGLMSAAAPSSAHALDKVSIVVFGPPSLGAFLQPVIKQFKLDEANGLAIDFAERTPDAYAAQFNSGEFQVGGSAAVLTVGLADARGVKVAYLFNLFDYWGAVVTSRPDVKTLKDLEGKDLAAARGTTNYIMFDWFARQQGVDLSKVSVVNTATPGLIGYALADRAAAIQLWEPAYTTLMSKKPGMRKLDLEIGKYWQAFAKSRSIPYLGVAAHVSWIEQHRDAGAEVVRNLQSGRRVARGASRRRGKTHFAQGLRRRPAGHCRSDQGQRSARSQYPLGCRPAQRTSSASMRPAGRPGFCRLIRRRAVCIRGTSCRMIRP